ncbi:hypothetical protein [Sporolactobacillus terrae]|uniref:hypothetical protein n=1 Tax=Sporolactobacillus terrae TaxID=269673 RepID=UPI001118B08A|nr:hypothetical protein [Sporolactobacillus terrae]
MSGTKVLISYLKNDAELMSLLNEQPNIFQLEKPVQVGDIDPFILILEKIVNSNSGLIHDVQFEIRIISENAAKTLAIQERLIELLDQVHQEYLVNDEDVIRNISLVNGGGTIKNPTTSKWETICFFIARI